MYGMVYIGRCIPLYILRGQSIYTSFFLCVCSYIWSGDHIYILKNTCIGFFLGSLLALLALFSLLCLFFSSMGWGHTLSVYVVGAKSDRSHVVL